MTDKITQSIINDILDPNDGPVNNYIAIYRALRLSKESTFDVNYIAEALEDSLKILDNKIIPSNEY